ncbi:hypothetical protein pqer_cds_243 [Pandoravirus quercus]|uniref:Uncharacterized protein n=1 Tax=Pandoravirus quercus TaxID=2107709 RepID=A0A2U7U8F4_9VIRU|nr:hypothetical protein pqer_cds_243 [Pandoravirus quercus]AVK74665.1 hypothetical protein pqer_cds_243 [Pandoravirus quercus]
MGDRPDGGSKCTRAPAFVVGSCVCTEREVRWSFFLLVVIITLVTISLVLFVSAVRYVKSWVSEKQRLRTDVKAMSRHASNVMRDAQQRAASTAPPLAADTTTAAMTPPPHPRASASAPPNAPTQPMQPPPESAAASKARTAAVAAADPLVHEMLDAIEAVRLGSCGRGFAFAVDSRGGVWAHGKTRHLARGATGRVPGFHRVADGDHTGGSAYDAGDDDDEGDSGAAVYGGAPIARGRKRRGAQGRAPSPLADMLGAARRGGGYVHFRWKREVLMMAYVHPVKGTDLVLGGAVPVPRKQKAWEEANATRTAAPTRRQK